MPVTCVCLFLIGLFWPTSTSSGDAPGHDTLTDTLGLLTSGNWLTPMLVAPGTMPSAIKPNMIVANINIHANTGLRRQRSVMFTARLSDGGAQSPSPSQIPCQSLEANRR